MNDVTKAGQTKHLQFDPSEREREELLPHKETRHEDYTPDTLGDPEGSAARAADQARPEVPDWALRDFELSVKDYYGKPFPDGKLHLIPRKQTIAEILDIHEQGMNHPESVQNCLVLGSKEEDYEKIYGAYEVLVEVLPNNDRFELMRGLQNTVLTRLAERARDKYLFSEAIDRKQPEEYIEKMHTRAMASSARAGLYLNIHQRLWKRLGWAGEPNYDNIERAVVWAQIRTADYIMKNHGTEPRVRQATLSEYPMNF